MAASRTKRTIQNSITSFFLLLIQLTLGFYSRKIFLDKLGDEVLGINTTVGNILAFLNLAELGIGVAMSTSLFKPLYQDEKNTICEIITLQGFLYKKIALLICCSSIPILFLFPIFFPSTECGLLYVYVVYLVFLWGSISGYLWNYRQVLIYADQKNYLLNLRVQVLRYIKIILQIIFLKYILWGIWGWIGLEFIISTITIFAINDLLKRKYPWLHKVEISYNQLRNKYKHLTVKTQQVFIHKISTYVLEQTSPLIIYAFVSLSMVTYYSNYMIIIGYTAILLNSVFDSMGASIGSVVAENNKPHIIRVFDELFTSRLWLSAIVCFTVYITISPFISLWIGEKYLLSQNTLILLLISLYIRMTRTVIDSFKQAYMLFGDIWAPITEAVLNLGCSIILGYYWGLNGILLGVNISLIIVVLIWKPYYTFKKGFQTSVTKYYVKYFFHIFLFTSIAFLTIHYLDFITNSFITPLNTLTRILIAVFFYSLITFVTLFIFSQGMRLFTKRIINIIHLKF